MSDMPFEDLERVYERLATAIDEAGEAGERLFLAKLVLLLAHRHASADQFEACVGDALQDLSSSAGTEPVRVGD